MSGMDVRNLADSPPFTTKDGSEIRELLAHRNSCVRNQSLAEARLPVSAATAPHYHPSTEEIYYLLEGSGRMQVEGDVRDPLFASDVLDTLVNRLGLVGR